MFTENTIKQKIDVEYISYEQINVICKKIVYNHYDSLQEYDTILTLTKGGLFTTGFFIKVSELFGFRPKTVISLDQHNINLSALNNCNMSSTIFMDDILDTGETIKNLEMDLNLDRNMKKIFLVNKNREPKYYPQKAIYGLQVEEKYINFPWDERKI